MKENKIEFQYEVYNDITELASEDAALMNEAKKATGLAYAPYSRFRVGAVAKLTNGEIVAGSNQENASYPAGLCAERVLLSSVSSRYPGEQIDTIAISYSSDDKPSNHPIAPCGICRQTLSEYETRMQRPVRLMLGGQEGRIFIIPNAGMLLPLAFTGDELIS